MEKKIEREIESESFGWRICCSQKCTQKHLSKEATSQVFTEQTGKMKQQEQFLKHFKWKEDLRFVETAGIDDLILMGS